MSVSPGGFGSKPALHTYLSAPSVQSTVLLGHSSLRPPIWRLAAHVMSDARFHQLPVSPWRHACCWIIIIYRLGPGNTLTGSFRSTVGDKRAKVGTPLSRPAVTHSELSQVAHPSHLIVFVAFRPGIHLMPFCLCDTSSKNRNRTARTHQAGKKSVKNGGTNKLERATCLDLLGHFPSSGCLENFVKRTFLPETYHCNQLWDSRLRHEVFGRTSPSLILLRDIDANQTVSPFDYDIFVNKLHELDVTSLDFAENVIRKYARTQSAVQINDSTAHALIRGLLGLNHADKLLSLLSQRSETAIFLDTVSANLLLDHFIDQQEWESAIKVAWELYLQDDTRTFFSTPITLALTLYAAQKRIQSFWPNENESTEVIMDSDEVEYKFVRYVRNANYDGRFDVDRPRLWLGFLLLQLAQALVAFSPPSQQTPGSHETIERAKTVLPRGLHLFGLACSDQLTDLRTNLQNITTCDQLRLCGLSSAVFENLINIIGSAKSRTDDSSPGYREPVLPTRTEIDTAMSEAERILKFAEPLNYCFFTLCNKFVHDGVLGNKQVMENETELVKQMYMRFEQDRDRVWKAYLSTSRKSRTLTESKNCLRELLDEEERLAYFKHSEEVLESAWLAPRTLKERRWSRMKQWRQDIMKLQEKEQVAR
ncbi:unnamed protein product [Dicrocoelium dendriticum]|nr:unnamed protein product [Dicrocoelium dendriticum]